LPHGIFSHHPKGHRLTNALACAQTFCNDCSIHCEQPNPKLYVFDGYVSTPEGKDALDAANLLLRGSSLRKTDWVIGVVVSTGINTKIVQNLTRSPRKITLLERHMNILVAAMFAILFVFSAFMAMGQQLWERDHPDSKEWYLQR
jgi:magnesium-transporting ATPase (P-type)